MAPWIPETVVPTSWATVAIETFMTELSSVIRNCPAASVSRTVCEAERTAGTAAALTPGRSELGEPLADDDPRGRVDQGEVRERLGEVAQVPPGRRVELLGVQPQRRGHPQQPVHQVAG